MKEIIYFVHGNGFPSPCYRQLLTRLESQFDCRYIEKLGHSPQFPVTENWHYLVDELIAGIKAETSKPVIVVGHSFGGVLSVFAAIEQPALFKSIVLLDSPLIGRTKSFILRLSKAFGMIDHITPAFKTRKRRANWKNREQAVHYLRRRALFKSFDEACLQDYIDYGMEKNEQGYSLRFDPEIEYQIYRTIPDTCYQYEGRLHTPTTLIYGDHSHLIKRQELRYMKKKFGIAAVKISGTHMFPFERPDVCAREVINILEPH